MLINIPDAIAADLKDFVNRWSEDMVKNGTTHRFLIDHPAHRAEARILLSIVNETILLTEQDANES